MSEVTKNKEVEEEKIKNVKGKKVDNVGKSERIEIANDKAKSTTKVKKSVDKKSVKQSAKSEGSGQKKENKSSEKTGKTEKTIETKSNNKIEQTNEIKSNEKKEEIKLKKETNKPGGKAKQVNNKTSSKENNPKVEETVEKKKTNNTAEQKNAKRTKKIKSSEDVKNTNNSKKNEKKANKSETIEQEETEIEEKINVNENTNVNDENEDNKEINAEEDESKYDTISLKEIREALENKVDEKQKKSVIKEVVINIGIAVLMIFYLLIVMMGSKNIDGQALEQDLKIMTLGILALGIVILEVSYKKDKVKTAFIGVETLVFGAVNICLIYISKLYMNELIKVITYICCVIGGYYIFKSIILAVTSISRFKKDNSDIKDIVVKKAKVEE